jgi:mRNA interferase MazF
VVVQRRDLWWAELDVPRGSDPGFTRPVIVIQADSFNRSRIRTVVAVALTSNSRLLNRPGNVLVPAAETGLTRDSVADVSQLVTLDREHLVEHIGRVPPRIMARVDAGLRLVLDL